MIKYIMKDILKKVLDGRKVYCARECRKIVLGKYNIGVELSLCCRIGCTVAYIWVMYMSS